MHMAERLFRTIPRTGILLLFNAVLGIVILSTVSNKPVLAQLAPNSGDDARRGCCKESTAGRRYCCVDCCNSGLNCDSSSACKMGGEEVEL
jgi:hypothetical protein